MTLAQMVPLKPQPYPSSPTVTPVAPSANIFTQYLHNGSVGTTEDFLRLRLRLASELTISFSVLIKSSVFFTLSEYSFNICRGRSSDPGKSRGRHYIK